MPTLTQDYNNGSNANDQTLNIAAAKGGPVVLKATSAALGSLLRALTSAAGVLFDVVDGTIPKVRLPGVSVQNDPAFGSPVICGEVVDGWLSVTSDGVGGSYAGTGVSMKQDSQNPDFSLVAITCNDNVEVEVIPGKVLPRTDGSGNPAVDLGDTVDGRSPFRRVRAQIYTKRVGAALASASTIAPDNAIHHVTGTTAISTITPPFTGFTGDVTLIMDNNCNLATGGNIDPYTVQQANLAATAAAAASGKAKVVLTYDGSVWY